MADSEAESTAVELETLREAVKVRDELLDEMQKVLAMKREESDALVSEVRRNAEEQIKVLKLRLDEKETQIQLLQGIVNDLDSNNRLNSDLQDIKGSEAHRERPFVDDFLLKVLQERDELTDKLHDMHNELVEVKAQLGTSELEKERLLLEVRTLGSRLSISSTPSTPERPTKPKRTRNLASEEVIRQLNLKIVQLEEELLEYQRQGSRLKRKETLRMREAEKLKTEMDTLAQERAKLLNDLRKTQDESTHLALVQTLENQLQQHEEQRQQLQNKLASLQRDNEESTSLIKHLQARLVEYEQAEPVMMAKDLQTKVSTLSDNVLERDERLHDLQKKYDDAREQNQQLSAEVRRLEELTRDKESIEERLQTVEAELELSQQALKLTREELDAISAKYSTASQDSTELQERAASLETTVAQKDADITALMAEIEKLNEEAEQHLAEKEQLEHLRASSKARDKSLREREDFCEQIMTRFKDEQKRRRALHNQLMELQGNIRVHCRIRPLLSDENDKDTARIVVEPLDLQTLRAEIKPGDLREFEFDRVHGPDATNESVFYELQTLITSFIDGYNVCIMAYGQTGSGKTHTMLGAGASSAVRCKDGIVFRAVDEVFKLTAERQTEYYHSLSVSVAEIYNNKIRDLLGEDFEGSHEVIVGSAGDADVPTLIKAPVHDADSVLDLVNRGMRFRAERTTDLNERSSRSHLIVTISCESRSKVDNSCLLSRLHMVDLAGSENNKMAKQHGDGLREASNINKSLSALGDVMAALDLRKSNPKRHIPYRNSKLTLMLKDAIGGNAKTLLLACASPTFAFSAETINTLRFGQRARNVQKGQISLASSK
eukprot:m.119595 g.119595  ORF g.119595 m.119595 type:complete len:837 (-) comp15473_c1_seq2:56-2566(-)